MSSNYNKGIYEQLEQVLNKIDKMMIKNRKLNTYAKEEINLLNRMKENVHNNLLFPEKFYIPVSNNRAETDLR